MSETQLDAFLKGSAPKDVAQTARPMGDEKPAPEAPEQAQANETDTPAETPADTPDEAADTAAETEAEPNNFRKLRSVVDATKKEREDWKTKATVAETRLEALTRELEEAKRAAATPRPPPQPQAPPNPAQDPAGYHEQVQRQLINERLNLSEMLARRELGSETVDALVAEFREEAARDETLFGKLYQQPDPYGWAVKELDRRRLVRDVGDDPAAYEAKLRAKWEAERGTEAPQPRISPAAGMQPSLAGQRSVAARTAPGFSGPPPMEDIFPRK